MEWDAKQGVPGSNPGGRATLTKLCDSMVEAHSKVKNQRHMSRSNNMEPAVKQYKDILNRLYGNRRPSVTAEKEMRDQLVVLWERLSDEDQEMVQTYSSRIRSR